MVDSKHKRPGADPEPSTEDLFDFDDPSPRDRDRDPHRSHIVSEFVRRAFDTVGQVQGTTVPRDAISFLLQQGDKGRREVLRIVANEVGDFLRHVDVASEIVKVMTSVQVDVSASIRFKPVDGGGVRPEVDQDSSVSVRAPTDDEEDEGA